MAKTKKQKKLSQVPVEVWEAHVCTCPHCYELILIREPVRDGDEMECPNCHQVRLTVEGIYSDCRKTDEKAELDPTGWGPFVG